MAINGNVLATARKGFEIPIRAPPRAGGTQRCGGYHCHQQWAARHRQTQRAVEAAIFKPFLPVLHSGTNYPMAAVTGGD